MASVQVQFTVGIETCPLPRDEVIVLPTYYNYIIM